MNSVWIKLKIISTLLKASVSSFYFDNEAKNIFLVLNKNRNILRLNIVLLWIAGINTFLFYGNYFLLTNQTIFCLFCV